MIKKKPCFHTTPPGVLSELEGPPEGVSPKSDRGSTAKQAFDGRRWCGPNRKECHEQLVQRNFHEKYRDWSSKPPLHVPPPEIRPY